MPLTVKDLLGFAQEAVTAVIAERDPSGRFGYVLFGPNVEGDPGREILLLEVTPEPWARFGEEDLTHRLPGPLPGRLFVTSMSRRTLEELTRADDPRLITVSSAFRVLRDPGRWLGRQLTAFSRRLARTS